MKRTFFLLAVVLLTCGLTYGGEQPGPNHDHLKFFDAYVGTWTRSGPLEEDLPFGKKGEVGTSSIRTRQTAATNGVYSQESLPGIELHGR